MTQYRIAFYLGLAKAVGKLLGKLKRTQTRLLTKAQLLGWQPEGNDALERLARDQFHLYVWRRVRDEHRKLKARI